MRPRHILVPTDFSPHSEAALGFAALIAERMRARVTLLHVAPILELALMAPEPVYLPPQMMERFHSLQHERLDRLLSEAARTLPPELRPTTLLRHGDPVTEIVGCALRLGVGLIVVGSRGRGATRFLLGSVSSKLARRAPCPVIIAKRRHVATVHGVFERILVAVDYSPLSRVAARFAADLARPHGMLELCHVWHDPRDSIADIGFPSSSELAAAVEAARGSQVRALERLAAGLSLPVRVRTYLATGTPADALLDEAAAIHADLIVMGAHARLVLEEKILGSTTDRVVRYAEAPVLVVPDEALRRIRAVPKVSGIRRGRAERERGTNAAT